MNLQVIKHCWGPFPSPFWKWEGTNYKENRITCNTVKVTNSAPVFPWISFSKTITLPTWKKSLTCNTGLIRGSQGGDQDLHFGPSDSEMWSHVCHGSRQCGHLCPGCCICIWGCLPPKEKIKPCIRIPAVGCKYPTQTYVCCCPGWLIAVWRECRPLGRD